jgi:GNAT superfamily N-acetyltransferase
MNQQYARRKTTEYFDWQFFQLENAKYLSAFKEQTLIGGYGVQIYNQNAATLPTICKSMDWIVDLKFRNRGLALLLINEVETWATAAGVDVIATFTNRNAWKALTSTGYCGFKVDSMTFNPVQVKQDIKADHFTEKKTSKNEICTWFHKSQTWRYWRYDQHPDYKYDHIILETGEFAVTKIFIDPITSVSYGDIVDFECSLADQDKLGTLFQKACQHLTIQGIEEITTWALPHTLLYNILLANGFYAKPAERYFCIKILNPEFEYLNQLHNWHLVQSDSEIY